jgi:antitoxin (DNA-binding transcriptional repressor) of toxin-antitoxin stability system
MKTISVREMKANWAQVEKAIANGEEIEVLNRGTPTVRLIPPTGRKRLIWDDHLATAAPGKGHTAEETVAADREGRW